MTKIAIAGKGGAGKTTLAGTIARLIAREGKPGTFFSNISEPSKFSVLTRQRRK